MEPQLPTFGQLEKNLSQNIRKLYYEELEHCPQQVTSKFFGSCLVIVIEDALTAVEKTLANRNNEDRVSKNLLILAINGVIKSKLKNTIEVVLAVEVKDILFNSNIETKRTGAIIVLSQPPQVCNPRSVLKIKPNQPESERGYSQVNGESLDLTTE